MKTLFDIRSDKQISNEHSLLLEIGKNYCTYAWWNKNQQAIDNLQFISFEETEAEESLNNVMEEIKAVQGQSVIVSFAFPQSILTPTKYFNNSYELLNIIYEQPAQEFKHDAIPEWQVVNQYSIPVSLQQTLQNAFSNYQHFHSFTPQIKLYNGFMADSQLSVHFTPQYFSVLLKKNLAIQLAQSYHYTTPLDVVYYLLKICYELELEQSSVYVILSGLVEKDSALFSELNQYFSNLHFAHPPQLKLPADDYPHHFFTSLYNLAACVS